MLQHIALPITQPENYHWPGISVYPFNLFVFRQHLSTVVLLKRIWQSDTLSRLIPPILFALPWHHPWRVCVLCPLGLLKDDTLWTLYSHLRAKILFTRRSWQLPVSTVLSRNTAAKTWLTTRRSAAPHICSNSSPPSTPCLTHGCLILHRESCSYQLAVLWKAQERNMPSASLPLLHNLYPSLRDWGM